MLKSWFREAIKSSDLIRLGSIQKNQTLASMLMGTGLASMPKQWLHLHRLLSDPLFCGTLNRRSIRDAGPGVVVVQRVAGKRPEVRKHPMSQPEDKFGPEVERLQRVLQPKPSFYGLALENSCKPPEQTGSFLSQANRDTRVVRLGSFAKLWPSSIAAGSFWIDL